MKPAFLLAAICAPALAAEPAAHLRVHSESPSVFVGQVFYLDLDLTNEGPQPLHPIDAMYCQFQGQWVIEGEGLVYNRAMAPENCPNRYRPDGSLTTPERAAVVEGGQTHRERMDVYVTRPVRSPLRLRLAYKDHPGAPLVRSEPFEIVVKPDEPFPVDIVISPRGQGSVSKGLSAQARVTNRSKRSIEIGTQICGQPSLIDWLVEGKGVSLKGGSGCLNNPFPPKDVTLEPGQAYEQELAFAFDQALVRPGPAVFRAGLRNVGHQAAWSRPLTVQLAP